MSHDSPGWSRDPSYSAETSPAEQPLSSQPHYFSYPAPAWFSYPAPALLVTQCRPPLIDWTRQSTVPDRIAAGRQLRLPQHFPVVGPVLRRRLTPSAATRHSPPPAYSIHSRRPHAGLSRRPVRILRAVCGYPPTPHHRRPSTPTLTPRCRHPKARKLQTVRPAAPPARRHRRPPPSRTRQRLYVPRGR